LNGAKVINIFKRQRGKNKFGDLIDINDDKEILIKKI
tara:strand:- start:246 stop:356 length:111 start_codon:yes stop_codon:yes gene_type:complete